MQSPVQQHCGLKQRESSRRTSDEPHDNAKGKPRHPTTPQQLPSLRTYFYDINFNTPLTERDHEKSKSFTIPAIHNSTGRFANDSSPYHSQKSSSGSSGIRSQTSNDYSPFSSPTRSFYLSPASFTPSPPTRTISSTFIDLDDSALNEPSSAGNENSIHHRRPPPLVSPVSSHSSLYESIRLPANGIDAPSSSSVLAATSSHVKEPQRLCRSSRKRITRPHKDGCTCRTLEGRFPTWSEMLRQVILSSENKMLTLEEIRNELPKQFPCVSTNGNGDIKIHDNTIRQNLSSRSCFEKKVRPPHRKNHYWTVKDLV